MNTHPQELRQVAHTAQQAEHAAQAPRLDLYAGIHKAMRAIMTDSLLALGRLDTDDEADMNDMAERLEGLLALCGQHLTHENDFVHPALEARASGASLTIATEHVEHVRHIAALRADLHALLLDTPSVMGVESIEVDQFQVRVVARTLPGRQFEVGRALRVLITRTLRAEGIHLQAEITTGEPTGTA